MYRYSVVMLLLLAAVTVSAEETFPVDRKDCYGDPFVINGKHICWTEFDNSIHPLRPAPQRRTPWIRASFSLPLGVLPTYNGFDGEALNLSEQRFGNRTGLHTGDLVVDRTVYSNGNLANFLNGRSWGARVRLQIPNFGMQGNAPSAFSIDLAYMQEKPDTLVQVWGSEFVSTGRYYESCPSWDGWCVDFGGKFNGDSQYNEHRVELHVLRAGLNYDLLHSFWLLSLEPGLGVELSTAKNSMTVQQSRFTDNLKDREVVQDRQSSGWLAPNVAPYVSLSADVYPLGRRGWVAIGVTTRFLLFTSDYWTFRDATLVSSYEIPIRSRRWSTAVQASLIF